MFFALPLQFLPTSVVYYRPKKQNDKLFWSFIEGKSRDIHGFATCCYCPQLLNEGNKLSNQSQPHFSQNVVEKTRAKTQYKMVQNRGKFHITSGSRLSKLAPQENKKGFFGGNYCNMCYECRLFTPDPQSRFQAVEVNKDRGWSHGAILGAKLPATASSLVDVGIIMDQRRRHGCSRHNAHNGPDLTTSAENSCAKTRDAT